MQWGGLRVGAAPRCRHRRPRPRAGGGRARGRVRRGARGVGGCAVGGRARGARARARCARAGLHDHRDPAGARGGGVGRGLCPDANHPDHQGHSPTAACVRRLRTQSRPRRGEEIEEAPARGDPLRERAGRAGAGQAYGGVRRAPRVPRLRGCGAPRVCVPAQRGGRDCRVRLGARGRPARRLWRGRRAGRVVHGAVRRCAGGAARAGVCGARAGLRPQRRAAAATPRGGGRGAPLGPGAHCVRQRRRARARGGVLCGAVRGGQWRGDALGGAVHPRRGPPVGGSRAPLRPALRWAGRGCCAVAARRRHGGLLLRRVQRPRRRHRERAGLHPRRARRRGVWRALRQARVRAPPRRAAPPRRGPQARPAAHEPTGAQHPRVAPRPRGHPRPRDDLLRGHDRH